MPRAQKCGVALHREPEERLPPQRLEITGRLIGLLGNEDVTVIRGPLIGFLFGINRLHVPLGRISLRCFVTAPADTITAHRDERAWLYLVDQIENSVPILAAARPGAVEPDFRDFAVVG